MTSPGSSAMANAAEVVMAFTAETLPQSVLDKAAQTWCDAVSVTVGGATSDAAKLAADYARTHPGLSPLFAGGSSSPAFAAFANGTAAAALDFEDGHNDGGAMHPASPITSALIVSAPGETTMLDLWVAQISGYEVALRVGRSLLKHGNSPWFHSTGTPGAIGAAVAICKLRGEDVDTAFRAAHIAWLHAPFSTGGWPMIKESIGWGAMTGVVAADLARVGMNKLPPGYIPNDVNINAETALSLPGVDDDTFVTSIGSEFESLNTYFKPFAACRWTHSAADGLDIVLGENHIDPARISQITVYTHEGASHLTEPEPRTIEHGQYSFEMVLSAIALERKASWREMSVASMARPERVAMARRVRIVHDPSLDHYVPAKLPARVVVRLDDGTEFSHFATETLGESEHPMSENRLRAKWLDLLSAAVDPDAAEMTLRTLSDPISRINDALACLFSGPGPVRKVATSS